MSFSTGLEHECITFIIYTNNSAFYFGVKADPAVVQGVLAET